MTIICIRGQKKLYIRLVSPPLSDSVTTHASPSILETNFHHLPASHKFLQINWKTPPCLTAKTGYLPCFIVKFKIKCLPASWLSIPFSDTDLMLQFCLPYQALQVKLKASDFGPMLCSNAKHIKLSEQIQRKCRWMWDFFSSGIVNILHNYRNWNQVGNADNLINIALEFIYLQPVISGTELIPILTFINEALQ